MKHLEPTIEERLKREEEEGSDRLNKPVLQLSLINSSESIHADGVSFLE